MIAIKEWFLKKQGFNTIEIKQIKDGVITIKRETEKAVLLEMFMDISFRTVDLWCPESCLAEEWERKVTPLDYHDYLVNTAVNAYENGLIPQNLIEHKRTRKGTSYVDYTYHEAEYYYKYKSSDLKSKLDKHHVNYMTFEEYKQHSI